MKKVLLEITDELFATLQHLANDRGVKINPLIEDLLRSHRNIEKTRVELGFSWTERPTRGRPRAKADRE